MLDTLARRRYLVPFNARRLPTMQTDVLILGGGVAGLRAAIEVAAARETLVVMKGAAVVSATYKAQGGIAAAVEPHDTPRRHGADTMRTGCGLCHPEVVARVVQEAPRHIRELIDWGARFDLHNGALALAREGGHSISRVVHASGDATGAEMGRVLLVQARARRRITLWQRCFAVDLLTHEGRVVGALLHHPRRGLLVVRAAVTILATGGAGCIFRDTTNPAVATGDGLALALRAGAALRDMEMVQFHPTALLIRGRASALISEAVRGEGAYLRDAQGRRFVLDFDPRGELAPRDVVSQAIAARLRAGQTCVFLDARHFPTGFFAERFPGLDRLLRRQRLDPQRDLIPVRPAAHYMVGGVACRLDTTTNLPGLLVCGEVASSGLHGANRLASNSLLEGLVFGAAAGRRALGLWERTPRRARGPDLKSAGPRPTAWNAALAARRRALQDRMWRQAGIVRDEAGLADLAEFLDDLLDDVLDRSFDMPAGWELQNMASVAACIVAAARFRRESRGVHLRSDFPDGPEPKWLAHTILRRTERGLLEIAKRPLRPAGARTAAQRAKRHAS